MTRRRRRYVPPRCDRCKMPILWLMLRGGWRPFDPRAVYPQVGDLPPNAMYPTEGKVAWPLEDLVEELMGRREITDAAARDEAYAFAWHALHTCPDPAEEVAHP